MNSTTAIFSRLTWFNLPLAVLLGLLQRSPMLRVVATAADRLASAPLGAMLRAATLGLGSLGAVHALAGATTLVTNKPSPLSATTGVPLAVVAFGVNGPGVGQPGSWVVGGSIPPGLNFSGLTAPATINIANLVLSGTPTISGTYAVTLQGWENKDKKGNGSPIYSYIINVSGAAAATAPNFTTQPGSRSVSVGGSVTFTASATGSPSPTFQWLKGGSAIAGATTSSYSLASAQLTDAGAYTVVATNSAGSATSSTAQLTVNPVVVTAAPSFMMQPGSSTVSVGGSVTFTASATGSPAPTFQWLKGGSAIAGATTSSYSLASAQLADAGAYAVVATNSAGSATSSTAQLTVNPVVVTAAPSFTMQPVNQTINVGGNATFIAAATGSPTPTFQWLKGGSAIAGATNSSYMLASAQLTDVGAYAVVVTNSAGSATSAAAQLTVNSTPVGPTTDAGRLVNLSILTNAGSGANVLTMGAFIGGTGSQGSMPLVIRAVGPTLGTAFGIPGVLADPVMTVNAQGVAAPIAVNNKWGGTAASRAAFAAVGAFALPDTSLDCAYVPPAPGLASGGYTVQVASAGNTTGLVIAEIYDASGQSRTALTPRLVNLSTLAQIDPGATLAVGFVIGGNTSCTVLVRAVGPTLGTAFGIGGVMADPGLVLFNNDTGMQLALNDDWGGSAALSNTMSSVGAFALADPASRDAVLVMTLPPGAYSARVAGKNGAGGTAIVEVYEVR